MESRTMRHFTKEEQKKYTDAISKLYKPTGVNIMDYTITTSDDLELEQLMTEVIKSSMKDETKVKIIKRLCNPKETYIPYYDGNERKPCEPMYSFFCNGWNKCEEKLKCCENCQTVRDVNGNCYLHKDGECDPKTKIKWEAKK